MEERRFFIHVMMVGPVSSDSSPFPQAVQEAMDLLDLHGSFSLKDLSERYRQACRTWHPSRFAGLTNNPGKYMQMYKKGESKTKEIQAAYEILRNFLRDRENA